MKRGVVRRCVIGLTVLGVVVGGSVGVAAAAPAPVTVRSGIEIDVDDSIVTTAVCTLGAVISPSKAVTAGHCGAAGQLVRNRGNQVIGRITANLIRQRADLAVITLRPNVRAVVDPINWGARFTRGEALSKFGTVSGFTRGQVNDPRLITAVAHGFSLRPPFVISQSTLTINTTIHSTEGDSGAGIRDRSGGIVGILSSGSGPRDTQFAPLSLLPKNRR